MYCKSFSALFVRLVIAEVLSARNDENKFYLCFLLNKITTFNILRAGCEILITNLTIHWEVVYVNELQLSI